MIDMLKMIAMLNKAKKWCIPIMRIWLQVIEKISNDYV